MALLEPGSEPILESMTDESVFNSFNLLNLVAGALLSQRTTHNIDDLYRAWMEIGLFDALVPESLEPILSPYRRSTSRASETL